MFKRSIETILAEALGVSPAVLISGARQVGKSTLCMDTNKPYRVFDNLHERESAFIDPLGYVAALPRPVVLDEIQKVPQLLEAIKVSIDSERINGSFLLTGSANVLDMKAAKDTLAGRIVEIPMWPLSQKELNKKPDENLVDILFKQSVFDVQISSSPFSSILDAIIRGGYPEIQRIQSPRGRGLWFDSYISTYVERDIRDVGELRDISVFIRFFNIIAPRSCSLINKSSLANDSSLSEASVSNYLSMLEMIYQISLLKPYHSNISKRFVKSPKLFMNDTGVLCHLLNITDANELLSSHKKGEIIETFVYNELLKHSSYSATNPALYHYRTSDKKEIDFVLERGEKTVAIEVKSSCDVKAEAFKHIIDFQHRASNDVLGVVFYAGDAILPFGDKDHQRYALPLSMFF